MTGHLDADCVIECLIEYDFIDKKQWKRNTPEPYYNIFFHIIGTTRSRVVFQINVKDGRHLISEIKCQDTREKIREKFC